MLGDEAADHVMRRAPLRRKGAPVLVQPRKHAGTSNGTDELIRILQGDVVIQHVSSGSQSKTPYPTDLSTLTIRCI